MARHLADWRYVSRTAFEFPVSLTELYGPLSAEADPELQR